MTDSQLDESDEVLVLRGQLGDRAALERLVGRWHEPVRELLRHITLDADAAEELAQETWVSALRSLGRLREPDRFRWWLFTIARRRAQDRFRSAYRKPQTPTAPDELVELDPATTYAHEPLAIVDDRDQLVGLLGRVDHELREVLVLHHLHDWPVGEVAAALDIPEGTVKSRLHRARRHLAPLIAHSDTESTADPEETHQ